MYDRSLKFPSNDSSFGGDSAGVDSTFPSSASLHLPTMCIATSHLTTPRSCPRHVVCPDRSHLFAAFLPSLFSYPSSSMTLLFIPPSDQEQALPPSPWSPTLPSDNSKLAYCIGHPEVKQRDGARSVVLETCLGAGIGWVVMTRDDARDTV
jgi:hypothetical protein